MSHFAFDVTALEHSLWVDRQLLKVHPDKNIILHDILIFLKICTDLVIFDQIIITVIITLDNAFLDSVNNFSALLKIYVSVKQIHYRN